MITKKPFIRIASAVAVVLTFFAVVHADSEADQLISRIKSNYSANKGLKVDFDMEIFWAVREKTEENQGTLFLMPGDKFRLEVGNVTYVCDGVTYWQYSKNSSQVIVKNLLDVDLSMHPSQVLSTYLDDFTYAVDSQDEKNARLSWKPENDQANTRTKSISVDIDKQQGTLKQIEIIDKSGNRTRYRFNKTKLNVDIPDDRFTFQIPEDARVLDTRD